MTTDTPTYCTAFRLLFDDLRRVIVRHVIAAAFGPKERCEYRLQCRISWAAAIGMKEHFTDLSGQVNRKNPPSCPGIAPMHGSHYVPMANDTIVASAFFRTALTYLRLLICLSGSQ